MNIQDVKNTYNLSNVEFQQLESCVELYSKDTTLKNAGLKVFNTVATAFGQSAWQTAINTLANKGIPLIRPYFDDAILPSKAQILAEYILKYLITKKSSATNQTQFLIPRDLWISKAIDKVEMDEILNRAVLGHGSELPPITQDVLNKLLKKEFGAIRDIAIKLLNNLEEVQRAKPEYQILNEFALRDGRVTISEEPVNLAELDDSLNQAVRIRNEASLNTQPLEALQNSLKQIRKIRRELNLKLEKNQREYNFAV